MRRVPVSDFHETDALLAAGASNTFVRTSPKRLDSLQIKLVSEEYRIVPRYRSDDVVILMGTVYTLSSARSSITDSKSYEPHQTQKICKHLVTILHFFSRLPVADSRNGMSSRDLLFKDEYPVPQWLNAFRASEPQNQHTRRCP